ncbi:hypothetical protein BCR37DRAFT_386693 [Protomyces lactucae-debilis]|uniref:Secreted protein n=1 Tax=Protomyces lactucae-debilis TaxID=2754530 RepID=A0A1Y2FLK9_PROLT|nr:uncharacterized protein BCR37DRAFT_386693 [Protomyces lactucae-debilis]ORY83655.1 hypothetical protein BCR37DRAFT_386693 [Protomyces lactucae-debilis]
MLHSIGFMVVCLSFCVAMGSVPEKRPCPEGTGSAFRIELHKSMSNPNKDECIAKFKAIFPKDSPITYCSRAVESRACVVAEPNLDFEQPSCKYLLWFPLTKQTDDPDFGLFAPDQPDQTCTAYRLSQRILERIAQGSEISGVASKSSACYLDRDLDKDLGQPMYRQCDIAYPY